MRGQGVFCWLGEGVSRSSAASVADRPQAVRGSYLGCAFITPAPPDPCCAAALPPSVLFFPTGLQDIPSDSTSQPSDLQLQAGTQALFIQRLVDADPFLFSSSSSSSLRAFRLRLQPTTRSSLKSMRASVQMSRTLFRLCLNAPAGQCCRMAVCPGWGGRPWKWQTQERHKGAFCCQCWSKPCFKYLLRWLLHKPKKPCF